MENLILVVFLWHKLVALDMRKIFILTAFVLPLFMTACWQSQQEPESTLELEEEIITIRAVGGEETVKVFSNSRWKLNTDQRDFAMIPEWHLFSNAEGNIGFGTDSMKMTITHNTTFENGQFQPRETVLSVELFDIYSDPIVRTLTIRQEADKYRIALDKSEEKVKADAGSLDVTVDAMGSWRVEKPDEITYSVKDNVCTIIYQENNLDEEREFLLTFIVTESPYPSATLKITQEKGESEREPEDPEDPARDSMNPESN